MPLPHCSGLSYQQEGAHDSSVPATQRQIHFTQVAPTLEHIRGLGLSPPVQQQLLRLFLSLPMPNSGT